MDIHRQPLRHSRGIIVRPSVAFTVRTLTLFSVTRGQMQFNAFIVVLVCILTAVNSCG